MELHVTHFSPSGQRVFPAGSRLERLSAGHSFTEGPVWDPRAQCLYFTDFPQERIHRWTPEGGAVCWREGANRAIGLSMDANGRLVAAESGARAIALTTPEGSEPIATAYDGKPFNSPNDVVVTPTGTVYFTDPYSAALNRPHDMGFNGVFGVEPDGAVWLVTDRMGRPNGLALSPDGGTLYVNDTDESHILAFALRKRGADYTGVFARVPGGYGPGAPDGMKVDVEGNVYVTGSGGLWVFGPDAAPLALLHTPEFTGNFCFGGQENMTLFLTSSTGVYSAPVGITGIGV
ncbi:SMP-30/gluconolactonase/LRE family protein [Eubacteriales bacterium OttesenSCG-928-A19]|nr:SMP-30/gluconolactonase/LRE family protein [Eubacteriales bacterium OttesenSCG-928-A19]